MRASKSSRRSRGSKAAGWAALAGVALGLALVSAAAVSWFHAHGYLLYYGDAEAHLNIARRIVDSRTPGYEQVGTVWLPLPHLLMLPFVWNQEWWQSGLAGAFPSAGCFVLAGVFLFAAARRLLESGWAALAAVAVAALNPNVLYLQSIPMSEMAFLAALMGLLWAVAWFRDSGSPVAVGAAALASLAATLARYEGWFLIPFAGLCILIAAPKHRLLLAFLYAAVASLGPLYWLGHNWWLHGDVLEFYRGPWSAKAIYQRSLDAGMARYPGDGDWFKAWQYFLAAAGACAGWSVPWLGIAGLGLSVWKRRLWPAALLALPPVFYILSIHGSGTPIFVPHLWPYSYYNTRYGLAALPLLAIGAACWVALTGPRFRLAGCAAVVLIATVPWLWKPAPERWVCWKESQVNSEARRAWTREAAAFLSEHRKEIRGVWMSFGDLTGIFREAGMNLSVTLHEGNRPYWDGAAARPDLILLEDWAVAISGDKVSTALVRAGRRGRPFRCVKMISLKGAPVIEIYRRD